MKNRMNGAYIIRFLCLALFLLPIIPAGASVLPDDEQTETTKELIAFPARRLRAEYNRWPWRQSLSCNDFGRWSARKGRYATPYRQEGARTVVFDVAGTIFLDKRLDIINGDLTIAGQSAPGQGVCIARYPVTINADNVIVRYLRFRVGNEGGGEPDGLGSTDCRNLIIDHCSISWSVDECCSIYGGENLTVQWCLVSESLRTAGHAKGKHGYGAIWGGAKASFHHNLLAHHESRVPRLGPRPFTQEREHMDMRNNVFYNWAGNGCYGRRRHVCQYCEQLL